jgi:hypothetical protein
MLRLLLRWSFKSKAKEKFNKAFYSEYPTYNPCNQDDVELEYVTSVL